jgi:hypothetical protein
VRLPTRRLPLIGALYALTLVLPFVIDALSERRGDALYMAGLFGLPGAALVIQVHAARCALQEPASGLAKPVMRSTFAFFSGAAAVLFVVLLPLAATLGTFDGLDGTGIGGGIFFVVFVVVFAIAMLVSGGVVIGIASAMRRHSAT